MNQRLKRWESPRKEGRNDKGKGGSARQRQKRKQFQMLRKKLKSQTIKSQTKREAASGFSFCLRLVSFTAVFDQTLHKQVSRAKPHNGFYILSCGEFESKLL